jgi:hypothetical protein
MMKAIRKRIMKDMVPLTKLLQSNNSKKKRKINDEEAIMNKV